MDFFGIGPMEMILVLLVALVFMGPARMMETARSLGKMLRQVRQATQDIPQLLNLDETLDQPAPDEKPRRQIGEDSEPSDTKPS